MRILQVHNFYQQKSGEETVLAAERELLRSRGCEVRLWSVTNDDIVGPAKAAKIAWQLPYSKARRVEASQEIAEFRPDIVHVHNFFPQLTPSVYDACNDAGVPVVQTLQNFRVTCAGAFLMRNGIPCNLCVAGSPYHAVLHRCYRHSTLGSFAVARMIQWHRRRNTWSQRVARFIAVTDFARDRFIEAGLPGRRIAVLPNFVAGSDLARGPKPAGALFVGRLSAEKGILTLIRAWAELDISLRVAGDGPLLETLRNSAPRSVVFLGRCAPDVVAAEMAAAAILVVPSEWYEGCPLVMLEAMALGLPIVATQIGGIPEIVADGETGVLVPPGQAEKLAGAVRRLLGDDEQQRRMSAAARARHRKRFSPGPHYEGLLSIYAAARKDRLSGAPVGSIGVSAG